MKPTNGLDKILTSGNFDDIIHSVYVPKTLRDRLDKIILYIYRDTQKFSDVIEVNRPAMAYAKDQEELTNMMNGLDSEGLIKTFAGDRCFLTIKGFEKAEALLANNFESTQCFVAMWFNTEMDDIFAKYIYPAVEAKTIEGNVIPNEKGYRPVKMDWEEFNKDIVDNIISEIRKSKFMVADFTENRNGVYFEAGFARGLGIEVIYTCREDYKDQIHFDVNHQNYILWKDGEDLYKKLRKRISATIT